MPTFEVDCNNYNINVSESFDPIQLRTHGYQLPNFGNETSNTYFKQEYHMYHEHNELFGGIRGVCWRSRYQLNLHQYCHTSRIDDTFFMFKITSLLQKKIASNNNLLFDVLNEVLSRMESDFNTDNPGVRIPCNRNDAVKTCLDGLYGMFNNLPCPTVHNVGDHACMKIFDIIWVMGVDLSLPNHLQKQIMALLIVYLTEYMDVLQQRN